MKNILFCLLILAITIPSSAQLTFTKKSDRLTEATGWNLCVGFGGCPAGTWIDNKNQINYQKTSSINSHEDNFSWMQMASLTNKGQKYHALIYQERTGSYEYPLTQQNWREQEEVKIQIMDAEEYAALKSAIVKKDGSDVEIKTKRDLQSVILQGDYDEAQVLAKIKETLDRDVSMETGNGCLRVNAQTAKGQDVVRFEMPGECSIVYNLENHYYEVGLQDFKKLLID
jgi:hypothetical protein